MFWVSLLVAVATPLVFIPYTVLAPIQPAWVFPVFVFVWLVSMAVLGVCCVACMRQEPRLAHIGFAVLGTLILFLLLGISVGPLKHFI
jgi:hypothetical protein